MRRFVLLATIILSASSYAQTDSLKVKLPPANSSLTMNADRPVVTAANQALSKTNFVPARGAPALEVAPNLNSRNTAYSLKNVNYSKDTKGTVLGFRWLSQVRDRFVVEVKNDIGTQEVDESFRASGTAATQRQSYRAGGLSDFHVVARGYDQRSEGYLHFGADLGLSNAAAEWGDNSADGNRLTGGSSLTPFVSYETMSGARVVGWKGLLSLRNNRSIEARSAGAPVFRFQETGGNILSGAIFSEAQVGNGKMGGELQLQSVGPSAWEFAQGSQSMDAHQIISGLVYAETRWTDRTVLIPTLGIQTLLGNTGNVDQASAFNLGLMARISL